MNRQNLHQAIRYAFEDEIGKNLLLNGNTAFLARVTCLGQRELSYRVKAPKDANHWLALLVAQPNPREWRYRMEHDADWSLATPSMRVFAHVAN